MNKSLRSGMFFGLLCIIHVTSVSAEAPIEFFTPSSPVRGSSELGQGYFGQSAENGRLVLTAHNGFFDSGSFSAVGPANAPEFEKSFIPKRFKFLKPGNQPGNARWHVWFPQQGTVELALHLKVPPAEAGVPWEIRCNELSTIIRSSAAASTQPIPLTLKLPESGLHTFSIRKTVDRPTPNTEGQRIELSGPAIADARLLRVRWRPSAVHVSYRSSTCPEATMWVFETERSGTADSYSPITTPFGYYGTTFPTDLSKARGFNFSMWAVGDKSTDAPPVQTMPYLFATGNPQAEFSGFGHEGSGVKLREWDCLDWGPTKVVQALRVEQRGERIAYYGYFFHEPSQQWQLYAAGMAPQKRRQQATFSSTGSFVEVPGPPQVQRSGDVERRVIRRGWFYGTDQSWHVVDTQQCNDATGSKSNSVRRIELTESGELASVMGGLQVTLSPKIVKTKRTDKSLPNYLQPKLADQLFELPVTFETTKVSGITGQSAVISYTFGELPAGATAKLYYGKTDCLTFVPRQLHGTEKKGASQNFYTDERTWQLSTEFQPVRTGVNQFTITGLEPRTRYYFRVFVTHNGGKSWAFESGQFETK